ncbi:MAG: type IX secretion system PorP/SprF family membrane protein [Vicingaceae bacterium]
MKKGYLLIIFSVVVYSYCFGQDPTFSQFFSNRLYLNPAFAGTSNCPRLSLNYRNQWPGIDNSFITYAASYDQQIDGIHGGVGLQLMRDQAGEGVLNTTSAAFMYSYQFKATRNFSVRAGFQATVVQKSLNVSNLRFGDMIDARRGFVYQSQEQIENDRVLYPDFSFGLIGFSKKLYFGGAVHHLTAPDEGFIGQAILPMRITGHFGAKIPLGIRRSDQSWSPNIIFQTQGSAMELNAGNYFSKGPVVIGMWYRASLKGNRDALIMLVGIETNELKIGYSYDFTVSQLNGQTGGSHEISISYVFPCSPKKPRFETINCPSF